MMKGAKLSLCLTNFAVFAQVKQTCLPVRHTTGLCPSSSSAPGADQGHHRASAALQPQSEAQVPLQVVTTLQAFMC